MSIAILKEYKGTFEVTKEFYETFKESVSTDESRFFMNHVYFDGPNNAFVATDGRRMMYHINYDINESFSGFYTPVKIGKTYKLIPVDCDGTFPLWKRVIPDLETMKHVVIDNDTRMSLTGKLSTDSVTLCNIIRESNCNFNLEFFTKILKHVVSFEIMKVIDVDNRAVLIIIDDNTHYVIMPMGK